MTLLKRTISIAAIVPIAILFAPVIVAPVEQAQAQQSAPSDPPLTQRTIKITAEQGHTIKQIVGDTHPPKSSGPELNVGDKAPADAKLQDFPELAQQKVPAVKGYRFFVHNDRIVIVSRSDSTIADIL
jgi:hypothetical protein